MMLVFTPILRRFGALLACMVWAALGAPMAQASEARSERSSSPAVASIAQANEAYSERTPSLVKDYGPLDPWAYALVHKHAARVGTPRVSSAAPLATSPSFNWSDAGVGAASTLGLVLVLGGAGTFAVRKRHAAAQGSS